MAITVTINGKQYTFRNLEEQVLFLTQQLEKVQQSLGSALPDPIAGPKGDTGDTGPVGPEGPRGKGIYGCSAVLPSPTGYQEGDFYELFDGSLYKNISGSWVLQTNLRGPQGPVGPEGGTEVIANPVGSPTDNLTKIEISGTIYENYSAWERHLKSYIYEASENEVECTADLNLTAGNLSVYGSVSVGNDLTVDNDSTFIGSVSMRDDLQIEGNVFMDNNLQFNSATLECITDENDDPLVICENFNDKNGNPRFVEGNLTMYAKTGFTWEFCKWSLSGSHLMIVISGTIANGTTITEDSITNLSGLPDYIKSKIQAVYSVVVDIKREKAYYSDWTSVDFSLAFYKYADDNIPIYCINHGVTTTGNATFRIQFDLLIDMA